MNAKSNILIELEGVSPLLAAGKHETPYRVPEGYFIHFADGMLDLAYRKSQTMLVPEGYFEGFAAQMLSKIRKNDIALELGEIAPLLNKLPKTMPYYLPTGYFEHFKVVREHKKTTEPVKVVSLFGNRAKKWMAAAAIILSIGLSWMYLNKGAVEPVYMASASQAEMDLLLNQIEADKLDGILEQEGGANEFSSLLFTAQEGVEKGIKNLSTEELNGYLENFTVPETGT